MKKIHIFGTSFSEGGGYDFGSPGRDADLKIIYKDIDEPKTMENFSWPGQMRRLIQDKDVEVINHSKCGFGNELIYRKVWDIVNNSNFKKEENVFLFEFSYVGRKEFYSKTLKDYFIVNYNINDMEHLSFSHNYTDFSGSKEYHEKISFLNHLKEVGDEFLEDTLYYTLSNEEAGDSAVLRNISYFVSFLRDNQLNYLYTSPPVFHPNRFRASVKSFFNDISKREENIRYTMGDGEEVVEGFVAFFNMPEHIRHELTIHHETHGLIRDMHLGLWGAKIVAQQTYNRLIDEGWVTGEYAEFPKKPNVNLNHTVIY